ncbi:MULTISPECIES: RdgB/HAM1 family non-canonical purine NTP pyrophosphatase [unclassified Methanoculleus]|uniref:RdgB/HAM1 family non-canonical purine NTP pyrophosphatase n=1 Tax=unclassified Methanoculleus TaxID=2619537 RepID=UPI0025FC0BEA|nr:MULTISPECIES: RdgB/HAM1 family non-canonical purine NTP pyrophosphatase [unclassified Methanoculleus]MCK9316831.1 RdgB/HAM1 family non-canonical purine NTP pyrophosphatase [Methanoculleus sp.]MDD2252708.1 RdgB/HAM1 family non-canonical purine NTP pyrophosphatase [Methanoculleus sp.]MDD2787876.1 RdgB/HAM1 family non-canonical purine NTP pyrophosphatase [Methanoculleus sp.]MDD3215309.1 RdgB/HAM1 family non-canonical purine NTP pyrophosphatase [Methanoculleus sp.]MDD4312951.1 RdgB/HAM1 family 
MRLLVVTSNVNKAREVAASFAGVLEVEHVAIECPEFRHVDVGEIARGKAEYAYRVLARPLIVDDTGLFIDALKGFPGACAAYVHDTIGNAGILKLMEGVEDRSAHFETAIAFAREDGIRIFRGVLPGTIVAPRGEGGFGYDPIFSHGGQTLAQMPLAEKSLISHRARALEAFRTWIEREDAS